MGTVISPLAAASIPGYSGHTSGPNGDVTRVVIHATVSACVRGGARNNAAYFQNKQSGGLAHYVVDPGEIIATCDEDTSCWHAPPNHGSIGVELTDWQHGDDWGDADHQAMLALAARLVADICARHGLPLVWLSPEDLLAGARGVTSHANVAKAWHKTDHTDPGAAFPVEAFLALASGGATTPAPHQEDDMGAITDPDQIAALARIDTGIADIKQRLGKLEDKQTAMDEQHLAEARRNIRRVGKAVNAAGIEGTA